ncbi:MAG: ATP-dependent endonuclease [Terrestrivirus sp.]|uniref:ATP-dependent endonuclease n=1 Tax=Terrestrivirus sp. TaxID=2487775 RepID=A0A3G4ZNS6_9VIRU|nr:MAG: ATP-dependent endonuclease [Terrestrivirus sp.]
MVHIKRICIDGFGSFNDFKLDGLKNSPMFITGTNGVGKSNFIELVIFALYLPQELYKYKNSNSNHKIQILFELNPEELKELKNKKIFIDCVNMIQFLLQQDLSYINFYHIIDSMKNIDLNKDVLYTVNVDNNNNSILSTTLEYEPKNFFTIGNLVGINKYVEMIQQKQTNNLSDINNYFICIDKKFNKIIKDDFKDMSKLRGKLGKYIEFMSSNNDTLVLAYRIDFNSYLNHVMTLLSKIPGMINIEMEFDGYIKSFNTINYQQRIITNNVLQEIEYKFETILHNHIKKLGIFITRNKYISKQQMINTYINLKSQFGFNDITVHNKLAESVNGKFEKRNKMYDISCNNKVLYKTIQTTFNKIICKDFDVIINTDHYVIDYEYKIKKDGLLYNCSNGEIELIDFLVDYYREDKHIIFVDEPCVHLSSQNKNNFRNEILKKESTKQIIIVTHNMEMIDNNCNIIYFKMDNSVTRGFNLELDEKEKKNLYEHREVLFSNNLLLVEGYDDFRFIKHFLEINRNVIKDDYNIVILGGKGDKIWKILDNLEIKYKSIYDFDLLGKKDNKICCDTIKFISNRMNKTELDSIIDNIKIDHNDIIECIRNSGKIKHIYTHALILTIITMCDNKFVLCDNKELTESKPKEKNILYDTNVKYLQDIMKKIEIDKHHIKQFTYIDFKKYILVNYNELIKTYTIDVKIILKDHPVEDFIDYINDIIIKNHNPTNHKSVDDFIESEIYNDNKFFIWKSDIKDLEGIAGKLFNCNFDKKKWRKISDEELNEKIQIYGNKYPLNKLLSFLKNGISDNYKSHIDQQIEKNSNAVEIKSMDDNNILADLDIMKNKKYLKRSNIQLDE